MKVEPGSDPGEFTITTGDGRAIRRDESRYWAKVAFRAHYLRGIRERLDAEFDRLADEAETRRKDGRS